MSKGRIWLGRTGSEQLLPEIDRKFSEGDFEITREGRTASGKLVVDVIAVKKKFTINYSTVTNSALETLNSLYYLGGILNLKIEQKDGLVKEYSVKFRPFSRSRMLLASEWLWDDITVELEEV